MNSKPERGLNHSDDTEGGEVILVEFVATMVPHDSPEFIEHARKGRPQGSPPIPDYLKQEPKPDDSTPAA